MGKGQLLQLKSECPRISVPDKRPTEGRRSPESPHPQKQTVVISEHTGELGKEAMARENAEKRARLETLTVARLGQIRELFNVKIDYNAGTDDHCLHIVNIKLSLARARGGDPFHGLPDDLAVALLSHLLWIVVSVSHVMRRPLPFTADAEMLHVTDLVTKRVFAITAENAEPLHRLLVLALESITGCPGSVLSNLVKVFSRCEQAPASFEL